FFSSRRRHTRFSRDWSSDVCSSDLRERKSRENSNIFDKSSTDASVFSIALSTPKGQKRFATSTQTSTLSSLSEGPKQTQTIPERRDFITSNYKKRDGTEITKTFSTVEHILAPFMTDP